MEKIKGIIIAIFTTLSAWLGILAVPVYILLATNIIDYITGLMAAQFRGQKICSYKSIKGISKKICMWLLVAVGALIDELILYATATMGFNIPLTFVVGSFVAVWLICNEIISILENIGDIGVERPTFLIKAIEKVKSKVEEKNEE